MVSKQAAQRYLNGAPLFGYALPKEYLSSIPIWNLSPGRYIYNIAFHIHIRIQRAIISAKLAIVKGIIKQFTNELLTYRRRLRLAPRAPESRRTGRRVQPCGTGTFAPRHMAHDFVSGGRGELRASRHCFTLDVWVNVLKHKILCST